MVARKLMDTSIYPSTIFERTNAQSVVKYSQIVSIRRKFYMISLNSWTKLNPKTKTMIHCLPLLILRRPGLNISSYQWPEGFMNSQVYQQTVLSMWIKLNKVLIYYPAGHF